MNQEKIKKAFSEIIEALGEFENKKDLEETPSRIAKSYEEIFSGIGIDPKKVLKKTYNIGNENLIIEKNIDFYSMCEHHFLPFFGTISIAYIPQKNIFGFGDLVKLVEILSKRPQLQERLTEEIAKNLYEILDCKAVYVIVKAKHLCMSMRGVKKDNTNIVTTSSKGMFEEDTLKRIEIINLLK